MATFYLDFEGGNDANNGTTFANRWKSLTTGATAARTAPGDTVRIMGSPAPTSLGQNGVWTSQALPATKAVTAATNATPISITCTAHGYSTGDTVVILGTGANIAPSVGTWEITVTGVNTFTLDGTTAPGLSFSGSGPTARLRNNTRVMLTTAVTQNIASTGPNRIVWISAGGANVITVLDAANFKEHRDSDVIAIQPTFTTGLAAYWPTGLIDLSGYQQVSFWIRQTTGTVGAAGAVDLRLCSDSAGATAVNTISIPNLGAAGRWMPVTVDLGTNLGSSIRSIALYVNTDNGAQTFLLNNIIACKASSAADSLTLTSLIGKNTTGETFWGIQSINGTRVMLDADTNATPTNTNVRGYYGTSGTVTTWKRETIKLGPAAAATTILQSIQEGSVTYSGGWDRTSMATQDIETWLDGQNGHGYGIEADNRTDLAIDTIATVRFNRGFSITGFAYFGIQLSLIAVNNNTGAPAMFMQQAGVVNIQFMCANLSRPFDSTSVGPQKLNLGQVLSNGAAITTISYGPYSTLTGNFYNNSGYGVQLGTTAGLKLLNCTFNDNLTGGLGNLGTASYCILYLVNCLVSDGVVISQAGLDAYIYSQDHDQVEGNHKIFTSGGLISSATDRRKTASGISWKLQPTNASTRVASSPLSLSLAKVACSANNLVTVKAWMQRDNAGLTMRLVCKGGQIAGVASDVTASVTTTNTWEEETITFTPTKTGVVEITAEVWGGTTFSGWVDDMTISQA
jgi:hypothetical protein